MKIKGRKDLREAVIKVLEDEDAELTLEEIIDNLGKRYEFSRKYNPTRQSILFQVRAVAKGVGEKENTYQHKVTTYKLRDEHEINNC